MLVCGNRSAGNDGIVSVRAGGRLPCRPFRRTGSPIRSTGQPADRESIPQSIRDHCPVLSLSESETTGNHGCVGLGAGMGHIVSQKHEPWPLRTMSGILLLVSSGGVERLSRHVQNRRTEPAPRFRMPVQWLAARMNTRRIRGAEFRSKFIYRNPEIRPARLIDSHRCPDSAAFEKQSPPTFNSARVPYSRFPAFQRERDSRRSANLAVNCQSPVRSGRRNEIAGLPLSHARHREIHPDPGGRSHSP